MNVYFFVYSSLTRFYYRVIWFLVTFKSSVIIIKIRIFYCPFHFKISFGNPMYSLLSVIFIHHLNFHLFNCYLSYCRWHQPLYLIHTLRFKVLHFPSEFKASSASRADPATILVEIFFLLFILSSVSEIVFRHNQIEVSFTCWVWSFVQ